MSIRVLFFGPFSEIAGCKELQMPVTLNTDMLLKEIKARFPGFAGTSFKIAVNQELTESNCLLKDGDEVALLAPFSGG